MCKVTLNHEKNGIEVRFDSKPCQEILNALKQSDFRWSNRQKMWYAKQTEKNIEFAKKLASGEIAEPQQHQTAEVLDLWNLTRVENIEERTESGMSSKEIAAAIKKHLSKRFPMFKFSITSSLDSISAYITESPYNKDSDEVAAVLEYMGEYIESWKPCHEYQDFYGGRRYPSVSYDCKFRDMTVSELNIRELFWQRKQEFEAAEKLRREQEYKEYCERQKEEHARYEAIRKQTEEDLMVIHDSVKIEECERFFVLDVLFNSSKQNTVDEYNNLDKEREYRQDCAVTKKVYMDSKTYELFGRHLLEEYAFIAGTGGSATDDVRINSMQDYQFMTKEERETVKWYNDNCVAVYCDNKLVMVVDAQGYDYCRYVGFVDEVSRIGEYNVAQVMTEEEVNAAKHEAEVIADISTSVITDNGWLETWDNANRDDYIAAMKSRLKGGSAKFTSKVVQQIKSENLKRVLYQLLSDMNNIQSQFEDANMMKGQCITILQISSLGGLSIGHVTFDSMELGSYAQYDKAVKLLFRPNGKKGLYYNWYYGDVIICDGWVNVPNTVLYDIEETDKFIKKTAKYLACDNNQYKAVSEYLKDNGIIPIINTYDCNFRRGFC